MVVSLVGSSQNPNRSLRQAQENGALDRYAASDVAPARMAAILRA
jgi:hypothetical protein